MNGRQLFVLFLLPVLAAGASAQGGPGADADRIRASRAQSNDAIARHDIPAIVSFLDEGYHITASVGAMSQGIDENSAAWAALFEARPDAVYLRTPDVIEISRSNPLAFESGAWEGSWTTANGPVRTGGSYSAMWRKVDGEWKVRSELFVALYCEGKDCP